MFEAYISEPEKRQALLDLYALMLETRGKKMTPNQKASKKVLKDALRGMGMLSLPFSCNPKKFIAG